MGPRTNLPEKKLKSVIIEFVYYLRNNSNTSTAELHMLLTFIDHHIIAIFGKYEIFVKAATTTYS